jgi:hypothetical protein
LRRGFASTSPVAGNRTDPRPPDGPGAVAVGAARSATSSYITTRSSSPTGSPTSTNPRPPARGTLPVVRRLHRPHDRPPAIRLEPLRRAEPADDVRSPGHGRAGAARVAARRAVPAGLHVVEGRGRRRRMGSIAIGAPRPKATSWAPAPPGQRPGRRARHVPAMGQDGRRHVMKGLTVGVCGSSRSSPRWARW